MLAKYKMQSSTMPKETILAQPKTDKEIHNDYENYVNMMMTSARNWSMANFDKNKTYERDGKTYTGIIQQDKQSFSINFVELGNSTTENNTTNSSDNDKKPWWKVW
jgi:PDZ domain-containing secreted protein